MRLDHFHFADPVTAIVHLATQPPNVLHQVTIRKDKTIDRMNLIRFGETPGDEALCWIAYENVEIIAILGDTYIDEDGKSITETPPRDHMPSDHFIEEAA